MDKKLARKITGILGIALLGLNLVLFSFRVYSDIFFWVVLGIVAIASFAVLRFLK